MVAEGEELGSNLLLVLHRRPAELGGLGKVARAGPALPPGPKVAKRLFCPGAALQPKFGLPVGVNTSKAMATAPFG